MEEAGEGGGADVKKSPTVGETEAPPKDGLLRDNMVDLATRFLTNSRVQNSPMEQRRAFLKKKGLTETEIDRAVQLAQQQGALQTSSNQNAAVTGAPSPPPLPPRPLAPPPQSRSWSEYAVMAAVVGSVGYAVVYFIRYYLIPWFQAPKAQEQRLNSIQSSVDQLQGSLTETLTTVNQSTQAIRDLLSEQQQHLQLLATQVSTLQTSLSQQAVSGQSMKEVKEEIASIKGLLLSRHQFPPTPTRPTNQSGIPAWQRVQLQPTSSGQKSPPQQNGLNPDSVDGNSSSGESSPTANGGSTEPASGHGSGLIQRATSGSGLTQDQTVTLLKPSDDEELRDGDD